MIEEVESWYEWQSEENKKECLVLVTGALGLILSSGCSQQW